MGCSTYIWALFLVSDRPVPRAPTLATSTSPTTVDLSCRSVFEMVRSTSCGAREALDSRFPAPGICDPLLLQIDQLGNISPSKNPMTPSAAELVETERFDQPNQIDKRHVSNVTSKDAGQEPTRGHEGDRIQRVSHWISPLRYQCHMAVRAPSQVPSQRPTSATGWALEDSNLRPQPCESDTGGLTG